jgi:hypothetical protein
MRALLELAERLGGTLMLDDIHKRIYIFVPVTKDISWIWAEFPYPPEKKSGHKIGRSVLWKKDR